MIKNYVNLIRRHHHLALGNIIEWYDFALYSFFAHSIALNFFPSFSVSHAILFTLLIFAVSMIARPIGGMLFGYMGDRYGHQLAINNAIYLMIISSISIGFIPNAQHLGVLAPILLLLARLIQGLSSGGQYGGSLVSLYENAAQTQQTQACSITLWMAMIGAFIASFVGYLCLHLTPLSWHHNLTWRIPFLLSAIGLCRFQSPMPPNKTTQSNTPSPLSLLLSTQPKALLLCVLLSALSSGLYFSIFSYSHLFMLTAAHVSLTTAFSVQCISLIISCLSIPGFAYLSDKIGAIKLVRFSAIALTGCALPAVFFILQPELILTYIAMLLLIVLETTFMTSILTIYCGLFPAPIRYSGTAIGYNLGIAVLGAFTPFIISGSTKATGVSWLFGVFITVMALLILCLIPYLKLQMSRVS